MESKKPKWPKNKITPKQRDFLREYIKDFNAAAAVRRAGFKYTPGNERMVGYNMLQKPRIKRALKKIEKIKSERCSVSVDYVINGLKTVAERCMQIEPVLNKKGEQVFVETEDGNMVPAFTFNAQGANKAFELLGRHKNMFSDNLNLTNPLGRPVRKIIKVPPKLVPQAAGNGNGNGNGNGSGH